MLRTKKKTWTADGGRRRDIWITKSLPELSSGETKSIENIYILKLSIAWGLKDLACIVRPQQHTLGLGLGVRIMPVLTMEENAVALNINE